MKNILINITLPKLSFAVVLLGSLLFLDACTPSNAQSVDQESNSYIGTAAPDFELLDYSGQPYSSTSFAGKFVVLHIATTWCPFCNAEAPHLQQLYKDYKDQGVEVIIIDVKESKELVKKQLVDRFKLRFPVLLDTDGSVAAAFAPVDVLPDLARDEVMLASNLLIDPQGKIQYFSLLDTQNFDAKLVDLKTRLHELL